MTAVWGKRDVGEWGSVLEWGSGGVGEWGINALYPLDILEN